MENQLDFYRSFHTHPINQNIHTVCIPAIVLCVLNYTSLIRIHFEFLKGNAKDCYDWRMISLEDLIDIYPKMLKGETSGRYIVDLNK